MRLFDLSNGFKVTDFKIAIFFGKISPEYLLDHGPDKKSFRSMTPPEVKFLKQKKVLGAQKSFLWPPKRKKLLFSKNWNYMIWLQTPGDSHSTQLQGPIGHFSGELL